MSNDLQIIQVAAALIFRRGQVLLASRPPGSDPVGWEFPGGKREIGETLTECLKREVAEELGVEIVVFDLLGRTETIKKDKKIELFFFRAMLQNDEAMLQFHDGQSGEWVKPKDLLNYDLLAPDRPVADYLRYFSNAGQFFDNTIVLPGGR